MKTKIYIFMVLVVVLLMTSASDVALADSEASKEQQIKAAFLYNFLKFVDWPVEKSDSNEPIIIGIINQKGFSENFELIQNKELGKRKIIIKDFRCLSGSGKITDENSTECLKKIDELRRCHMLFFYDRPEKENLSRINKELENSGVLTVGQTANFLENGGNINFVMEDEKVRFEINLISTKQNNLNVSSRLLKLAKKVVK